MAVRRHTALLLLALLSHGADAAPLVQPTTHSSANGVLDVNLTVTTGRVDAGDFSFNARLYSGAIPGPTLIISAGDLVRVLLRNELGANANAGVDNEFRLPNTTGIHTHGLHVSSQGHQDNMFVHARPGESVQYEYAIHAQHLGGTHWYHPHFHGSTALQLGGGMAGVIVVRDDPAATPAALAALTERIMLLQHINVGGGGQLDMFTQHDRVASLSRSELDMSVEGSGQAYLVNGQKNPTATMQPGEWQRWRLAHASTGMNLELVISSGCEMQLIANDGVYLTDGVPLAVTSVALVPGSRRDIIVRCASPGTFALSTRAAVGEDAAVGDAQIFASATAIVTVLVEGAPVTMAAPTSLPSLPAYMPDLRDAGVTGTFAVEFDDGMVYGPSTFIALAAIFVVEIAAHVALWHTGALARMPLSQWLRGGLSKTVADGVPPQQQPSDRGSLLHWLLVPHLVVFATAFALLALFSGEEVFLMNNEKFQGKDAFQHTMALGSVQEWIVSGDHPFHIHVNHFQLISMGNHFEEVELFDPDEDDCADGSCDFGFVEGNYYDVITHDWPTSKIRFKPADYTGTVVMHCHNAGHADKGMTAVANCVAS